MANELRVRSGFLGGLIEDNPLTAVATTLTSASLASAPTIGSTQHMALVLDPDGFAGAPEIVYITAHSAAATTATILRAQEGTTARQHDRDMAWVHSVTVKDFDGPWRVDLLPAMATPSATVGTWSLATWSDGGVTFLFGGNGIQSITAAQNDALSFDNMALSPGTWNIEVHYRKSTNTGVLGVNIDGVSAGTIDTYAAAAAAGRTSLSGVVIASGHLHTVQLLTTSKNASSSGFAMNLFAVHFRRTA